MHLSESATVIHERPGPVRLVAVDGPGGAGKTAFAAMLASALGGAPVVHTDDFASWDEPTHWWPRMLEQVLLSRGTRARYQRYDWPTRSLTERIDVGPEPVVFIEGVSAGRCRCARPRTGVLGHVTVSSTQDGPEDGVLSKQSRCHHIQRVALAEKSSSVSMMA